MEIKNVRATTLPRNDHQLSSDHVPATCPVLKVTKLNKNFGGVDVINNIDMEISEHEIRCIIGPNGAGKSTFFKLLTGEHSPSSGEILFLGKSIRNALPFQRIRRGMSIKFQIPGVFPELTVSEHLELSLHQVGKNTQRYVDDLLNRFKLTDEAHQTAANLSHGKRQWLEMAMAVSLEPRLLMLDEPVAGMSMEETHLTGELIRGMQNEGLTIMVVEHDMTFVRQVATRVSVLHRGRLFADGSTEEVLSRDDVADIYLGRA